MAIYFGTFIVSYLFCWYGEQLSKESGRKGAVPVFCLAVLVPAILAGIRDYTIGTDIATYGHWLFVAAKSSSNPMSFAIHNPSIDFLYSVFVYCIAHLFETEHWLYFFTGLLIYGFTLAGLFRYRKHISISIAWLCYLFLFYGDTLNAMRQCIALAILVLAFSYFQTRDMVKFGVLTVMAFLFHTTSIIIVLFVATYFLLEKKNDLQTRTCILAVIVGLLLGYAKIIDVAVNIRLLDVKFLKYGNAISTGFSLNPLIIRLPYLLFIGLFYSAYAGKKKIGIRRTFADFTILMIILEMLTAEMRSINPTLYRISLYFGIYRCIGIGQLVKSLRLNNRRIITAIIWIMLTVTWYYQNVIQGNNQIYPFTSALIGI